MLNIEALGINIRELRKQSDDLFLGIDGGGTKTEFVLVSSEGYVLKRLVKSGCNPNDIGYDQRKTKETCYSYCNRNSLLQ